MLVLSEADWASTNDVPLYGLPNAGDGTLTGVGSEAPFWSEVGSTVADRDRAELEAAYREPQEPQALPVTTPRLRSWIRDPA